MSTIERSAKRPRKTAAPPRVYCAGPLFNRAERSEMAEIATTRVAALPRLLKKVRQPTTGP